MKRDDRFERRHLVRRLKARGDGRWRRAAQADLRAVAEDDEGARLLAAAISAMLRRD